MQQEILQLEIDILNHAPCGLHALDGDGKFIYINQTELDWLGYEAHELVGVKGLYDLLTEESKNRFHQLFETFKREGKVSGISFDIINREGKIFPIQINSNANYDEAGNFISSLTYVVNLTEHTEKERSLKQKTKTLDAIFAIGQTILEERSLDSILQKVTDATTELTGAQFGAFFYNSVNEEGEIYQLFTLSGAPRAAFEKFGMPRNTAVFEHTFMGRGIVRVDDITKDPRYGKNAPHFGMPKGHLPVVSYLAVPVVAKSGTVIGGLFFGHPEPGVFTSEAEKMVEAIAWQAAIAIENAKLFEALKEANKKKDDFISIASHELKTPLTSISLYIQLLERTFKEMAGPGKAFQYLHKTKAFIKKLRSLIEDLLDVSRIQAGKLELRKEDFDLNPFIKETLEDIQNTNKSHTILIRGSTSCSVSADKFRIEQVMVNLVGNSIKYSPLAREILVEIKEENNFAIVAVTDYGIGINENEKSKIFDRYHREVNENRFSGLGLGLFISKVIIEMHEGKLWFTSSLGKGSSFYFSLPCINLKK
ncbi:MAG: domain S-box protein [Chitinophagaceae bacterium]|nr:domain S-box protein [Chitinophagaceae bacterium]